MTMKKPLQNQVNNPEKKKSKWDDNRWKIYFKFNGASMLMFDHLTGVNAIIRTKALKRLYNDWKGHFIITK